jgi:hypothetical protein
MVGEMTKIEMSGSFMWIKYFNLHVLRPVDEPKIVINIYNSSRTVKSSDYFVDTRGKGLS